MVKHKTPGDISRVKIFCLIVTEDQYSLDLLHTSSVPARVLPDSADAVKLDCALRQLFIITYLCTVFQNYTKFVRFRDEWSFRGQGGGRELWPAVRLRGLRNSCPDDYYIRFLVIYTNCGIKGKKSGTKRCARSAFRASRSCQLPAASFKRQSLVIGHSSLVGNRCRGIRQLLVIGH